MCSIVHFDLEVRTAIFWLKIVVSYSYIQKYLKESFESLSYKIIIEKISYSPFFRKVKGGFQKEKETARKSLKLPAYTGTCVKEHQNAHLPTEVQKSGQNKKNRTPGFPGVQNSLSNK